MISSPTVETCNDAKTAISKSSEPGAKKLRLIAFKSLPNDYHPTAISGLSSTAKTDN